MFDLHVLLNLTGTAPDNDRAEVFHQLDGRAVFLVRVCLHFAGSTVWLALDVYRVAKDS